MYPPQTSFIPVTVALVRFVEVSGFDGLYPYWYLGSTPVKYLTGPVVPAILVGLHKLLADFSLFDLSYIIILTSYLIFSVGWGVFAAKLSGDRKVGWLVGILSLVLPWCLFSALALSEVSAVVASSLTPWVLWSSVHHFKKRSTELSSESISFHSVSLWPSLAINSNLIRFSFWARSVKFLKWFPSLLFAILLLTNTTASIPAIVGLAIISIFNFKRVAMVIFVGWVLATVWYGLDFWWTTLLAPSIGGKSAAAAFVSLVNLLRSFVPVILAFVIVFWGFKPKTVYQKFTLSWLTIFGSLTLFRFMADPDFWLDWTSWISEVEIGLALLIGIIVFRSVRPFEKAFGRHLLQKQNNSPDLTLACARQDRKLNSHVGIGRAPSSFSKWLPSLISSKLTIYYLLFSIYLIVGWGLAWQKRDFWLPRDDTGQTVEFRIAQFLKDNVREGETVFLSGTTAFWLDALANVKQVRGGRDEASVDNNWRDLAWEVREGLDAKKSYEQLKRLGIDYLVVHTQQSGEFYHDFANSGKFENSASLQKIYQEKGDIIYKVKY